MAIQVNGTTVIDNSRQLTNIASVDATTASAFSSAGVGGNKSWNVVSTYTNNTERSGTYNSGSTTLGTLPSSPQVKAFGAHIKFDGKVTTNNGTQQWNCKFIFSNSNSMSSNSYYLFSNWDYTSGYWPSINAYHTFEFAQAFFVNPEAYNMSTNGTSAAFGQETGGFYYGNNSTSISATSFPQRTIFAGSWANLGTPTVTNSNFPSFTPSSTIYTGFHLNATGGYSSGYIRNVSVKLIALY